MSAFRVAATMAALIDVEAATPKEALGLVEAALKAGQLKLAGKPFINPSASLTLVQKLDDVALKADNLKIRSGLPH